MCHANCGQSSRGEQGQRRARAAGSIKQASQVRGKTRGVGGTGGRAGAALRLQQLGSASPAPGYPRRSCEISSFSSPRSPSCRLATASLHPSGRSPRGAARDERQGRPAGCDTRVRLRRTSSAGTDVLATPRKLAHATACAAGWCHAMPSTQARLATLRRAPTCCC